MELRERELLKPGQATGRELSIEEDVAIVGGEVSLAALDAALVRVGKWLAVDGPGEGEMGLLVGRDSCGPMLASGGGWAAVLRRAWVEDGRGKVWELDEEAARLVVGSRGALGRVVKVEVRLAARPVACLAARVESGRDVSRLAPTWCVAGRSAVWAGWLGTEDEIAEVDGRLVDRVQVVRQALAEDEALRLRLWRWPEGEGRERVRMHYRADGRPETLRALVLEGRLVEWVAEPVSGTMLMSVWPREMPAVERLLRLHGGWLERVEQPLEVTEVAARWGVEAAATFAELSGRLGFGRA